MPNTDSAGGRHDLSWQHWTKRAQRYYRHLEDLFWADLIGAAMAAAVLT